MPCQRFDSCGPYEKMFWVLGNFCKQPIGQIGGNVEQQDHIEFLQYTALNAELMHCFYMFVS